MKLNHWPVIINFFCVFYVFLCISCVCTTQTNFALSKHIWHCVFFSLIAKHNKQCLFFVWNLLLGFQRSWRKFWMKNIYVFLFFLEKKKTKNAQIRTFCKNSQKFYKSIPGIAVKFIYVFFGYFKVHFSYPGMSHL